MRTILGVTNQPSHWLSGGQNASLSDVRLWLSSLRNSSMLLANIPRKQLLAELSKMQGNQNLQALLECFISNQPTCISQGMDAADFLIGDEAPHTPMDSSVTADAVELANALSAEFPNGISTEDAYRQTFGRFIKHVRAVTILDPYAGSSATSRNKGRAWLIHRLVTDGVKEIHILTTASLSNSFRDRSITDRLRAIEKAFRSLEVLAGYKSATISYEIYEPNPLIFHNRRIRFRFDAGSVCFSLEKGIDGFSQGLIDPGSSLSEISEEGFSTYVQSVRATLTKLR